MSFRKSDWLEWIYVGGILGGIVILIAGAVLLIAVAGTVLFADGCGHTAKHSELIGQVKSVSMETPLICHDYVEADISLGILRAGSGSMSKHDVDVLLTDKKHVELMRAAAESGRLVRVTYDKRRMPACGPEIAITAVEFVDDVPPDKPADAAPAEVPR